MLPRLKALARKAPMYPEVRHAVHDAIQSIKDQAVKLAFRLAGGTRFSHKFYNQHLAAALPEALPESDISDHLGPLFFFAMQAKPKLMVELGTRGGESTRSLLAAAFLSKAVLLSIDIDDWELNDLPYHENWHFVQADDIEFGKSSFVKWCHRQHIKPVIDVLLIDTTHEYEHTKKEIATWMPFIADDGIMIFHDTNMGKGIYARTDGSVAFGWDNNRGVMRAIENMVGRRYNENFYFYDFTQDYLLLHYPYSNGLTIVKRHKIAK
jgi:predicted O-methyltransferase YrrM